MQSPGIAECSRFVDDGEPWLHLRARGFKRKFGRLEPPPGHTWSELDREAVLYLCDEWQWTRPGQEIRPQS